MITVSEPKITSSYEDVFMENEGKEATFFNHRIEGKIVCDNYLCPIVFKIDSRTRVNGYFNEDVIKKRDLNNFMADQQYHLKMISQSATV